MGFFVGRLAILLIAASLWVMMRHDVAEERYLELAKKPEFAAGRIAILDPRVNEAGERIGYTAILIGPRHLLTVGHPVIGHMPAKQAEGSFRDRIQIGDLEVDGEYAFVHPAYIERQSRGADLAIIRLKGEGINHVTPAPLWIGGLKPGDRIVGVGQGKSGTGHDRQEPRAAGTFRGYENTIDYLFGVDEFEHFRTDFDDGTSQSNSLANVLFDEPNGRKVQIKTKSSKKPLPLEGTTAAGDSGSGVWINKSDQYLLAGVAAYRFFSMYGGQAGYVNLSHPSIADWINEIAERENAEFSIHSAESLKLTTDHDAELKLKLAETQYHDGDSPASIATLKSILAEFPQTEAARKAKIILGRIEPSK